MTGTATGRGSRRHRPLNRRGYASVMALALVVILMTFSVAMMTTSTHQVFQGKNLKDITEAQLAAEGGLGFTNSYLAGVAIPAASPEEALVALHDHLAAGLEGTNGLQAGAVVYDDSQPTGPIITAPEIALPNGSTFRFTIRGNDGNSLALVVTGRRGQVTRTVGMAYAFGEDTRVLTYALASRPRIIARGNIHVDGDLCSSWTRTSEAAPLDILLGAGGEITGGIKTVLSQDQFEAEGSQDAISADLHDKLSYDEPPFAEYTTDDFDTSAYRDLASQSLPNYDYRAWEGFPETSPSKWYCRKFYTGTADSPKVLNNVSVPAGNHAHFKNCKFTGYTYIEASNNIVFENCTFEGPVITGVPSDFHWINHSLYFKGDTTITNDLMPESTILAPNFNVNIGDFHKEGETSDSKITGILVGGIVDIRDNAVIDGTILSMADLDHIGSSIYYYGSNLGYWEQDAEEGGGSLPETMNIRITPQPDNPLPLGIKKKYWLSPAPDSYAEIAP